jgi:hypothetical protein
MKKIFVKLNLRTKKFSGTYFFSGKTAFKDLSQIPFKKQDVIIYTGNGNNIHPSLWQDKWFKTEGE